MRPDDNEQNASRCLCPGCPTYDDCMASKDERFYCSRGKSGCEPSPMGCICGECPVWAQYELNGHYYCVRGAAAE